MKTKTLLAVVAITGILAACASTPDYPGRNLLAGGFLGEIRSQEGEGWELVDGVVTSIRNSERSFIVTNSTFSDFEMNAEFYVEGSTNSGVFARCGNPQAINPVDCYEFNIWDSHQDPASKTGAIVRLSPPMADVSTEDKWNTLRIIANGNRLQFWVNGVMTNDIEDDSFETGVIGFQYGGDNGLVRFRNLYVQELNTAM